MIRPSKRSELGWPVRTMEDEQARTVGEDAMKWIKQFVHWAWTRVSIARYRQQQTAMTREDRDAAERLEHLENGGSPYGDRSWGGVHY